MLPSYYEFQNRTKICAGLSALDNLAYELNIFRCARPLVLSDKAIASLGLLDTVISLLGEREHETFTDIPPDSGLEVVKAAAELYRSKGCDGLVAVGGGSVLDTAKGVRMLISHDADNLLELMGCEYLPAGKAVALIAIPTTTGTGSEVTSVAVISHPSRQVKLEFITAGVQPDTAMLDPRMTQTLPPRITASTGMDALCHAVEAYSCTQKNPLSDSYAVAAVDLVAEHLVKVVEGDKDPMARLALANAAMLAGAAFSNSMVGAVHAIGHALGGVCHLAHGDAMSILLPHVMAYNMDVCGPYYARLLLHLVGAEEYVKTPVPERGERCAQAVRELARRLNRAAGLPLTLSETGRVEREQLEQAARTALNDGAIIANPKAMDIDDVLGVLNAAW